MARAVARASSIVDGPGTDRRPVASSASRSADRRSGGSGRRGRDQGTWAHRSVVPASKIRPEAGDRWTARSPRSGAHPPVGRRIRRPSDGPRAATGRRRRQGWRDSRKRGRSACSRARRRRTRADRRQAWRGPGGPSLPGERRSRPARRPPASRSERGEEHRFWSTKLSSALDCTSRRLRKKGLQAPLHPGGHTRPNTRGPRGVQ